MLRDDLFICIRRKKNSIDRLLVDYESPDVIQRFFPGAWGGNDRDGRPIYVLRIGDIDVRGLMKALHGEDAWIRHVCRMTLPAVPSPLWLFSSRLCISLNKAYRNVKRIPNCSANRSGRARTNLLAVLIPYSLVPCVSFSTSRTSASNISIDPSFAFSRKSATRSKPTTPKHWEGESHRLLFHCFTIFSV